MRELRQTLSWTRGDAVFLAEANVSPQDAGEYFGPGSSRMHMLFNFIVNEHLMLALARQNAEPLERCLKDLPKVPHGGSMGHLPPQSR